MTDPTNQAQERAFLMKTLCLLRDAQSDSSALSTMKEGARSVCSGDERMALANSILDVRYPNGAFLLSNPLTQFLQEEHKAHAPVPKAASELSHLAV